MPNRKPAVDRFWTRVKKTDTCWLWTGGRTSNGYGNFRSESATSVRPHRFAYETFVGPIPPGMVIDHTCHVVLCVRPDHLRAVTVKQNLENRAVPGGNNKHSGILGVHWFRGKWRVRVIHNYRSFEGGMFTDLAEAQRAAVALRNSLFTHNDLDRVSVR